MMPGDQHIPPPGENDEYQRMQDAYDPDERCADPPDDDCAQYVRSLEVEFAIPCYLTEDQVRRLHVLVDEIVDAPCNQPKEGVHWPAGYGSKPHWSVADCHVLGKTPEDGAPKTGEPTFDDSVYHIETCSREFVSDKERTRTKEIRNGTA